MHIRALNIIQPRLTLYGIRSSKMSSAMEIFDIFNASNEFLGREYRKNVHKFGLYHRAVRMFVFNSKGEILTQRRVPSKDIAPNAWDLSAAEHLKPCESYVDGAVRGLKEELDIDVKPEQMIKLRSSLLYSYVNKEKGIKDFEFNETYKVIYDGEFTVDQVEVAEAKFVSWDEFVRRFEEHPEQCTPWLVQEMNLFKADHYKSLLEHK